MLGEDDICLSVCTSFTEQYSRTLVAAISYCIIRLQDGYCTGRINGTLNKVLRKQLELTQCEGFCFSCSATQNL